MSTRAVADVEVCGVGVLGELIPEIYALSPQPLTANPQFEPSTSRVRAWRLRSCTHKTPDSLDSEAVNTERSCSMVRWLLRFLGSCVGIFIIIRKG